MAAMVILEEKKHIRQERWEIFRQRGMAVKEWNRVVATGETHRSK